MFTLPQGDQEAEGTSDSCPVHLTGETVSEFKNFLWVLYALYVHSTLMSNEGYYHLTPLQTP